MKEPMPVKAKGESDQDYKLRLRQWNIRQNRGGSKMTTQPKKPATAPKKESSGGFLDKLLKGLDGKS